MPKITTTLGISVILGGFAILLLGGEEIAWLLFFSGTILLLVSFFSKKPTSVPIHRSLSTKKFEIECKNCGHMNPAGFNYCGKCGHTLVEEETRIY